MADKFLLSSDEMNVRYYFTADKNGVVESIGTSMDWSRGFTADILSKINNDTFSNMNNCKVYINSDKPKMATLHLKDGDFLNSGDYTNIDTNGYSGINGVTFDCSPNCKIAFSQNQLNYFTYNNHPSVTSEPLVPHNAQMRTKAGVVINEAQAAAFDSGSYTVNTKSVEIPITIPTPYMIYWYSATIVRGAKKTPIKCELMILSPKSGQWERLDQVIINTDNKVNRTLQTNYQDTGYTKIKLILSLVDQTSTDPITISDISISGKKIVKEFYCINNGTDQEFDRDLIKYGSTPDVISALKAEDWAKFFSRGRLDFRVFIPKGSYFNSLTVNFPANSAPQLKDFVPSITNIHAEDVSFTCNIKDPEGSASRYQVFVNDQKVSTIIAVPKDGNVKYTIPNKYFTKAPGINIIKVRTIDALDAKADYNFEINKVDKLPGYIDTLKDNKLTFTFTDEDNDNVKYEIKLNGKTVKVADFDKVPVKGVLQLLSSQIKIGEENELDIIITDSVGGVTTVKKTFIGEMYGLLFIDENGKYLSTELGEVLKKLDFGILTSGKATLPKTVTVYNHSSNVLHGIEMSVPTHLDGREFNSMGASGPIKKVIGASLFVQLSKDDGFLDKEHYFNLPLDNMVPNQKQTFNVRIVSTKYTTKAQTYEFDTNIKAIN